MTLSPDDIQTAADRLDRAARTHVPAPPVRDVLGSTDVGAAYAVQRELIGRRTAGGTRVVGRKIGLTSLAVQRQLGVDQPDFGVLLADMQLDDAGSVPVDALLQPKVEAEVAFVLSKDLDEGLDLDVVRGAVGHAVAALEIVDSRVADWDITIVDTIADNGSSALFVLGSQQVSIGSFEPRDVEMTLSSDGEVVSKGAACLGDPLEAVLWLARTAQSQGDPLRAGDIVLSGALGPMVPVTRGSTFRAEISRLGSVSITFTSEESS
jgi:2-keto-4-pentenoate hydratase